MESLKTFEGEDRKHPIIEELKNMDAPVTAERKRELLKEYRVCVEKDVAAEVPVVATDMLAAKRFNVTVDFRMMMFYREIGMRDQAWKLFDGLLINVGEDENLLDILEAVNEYYRRVSDETGA